MTEKDIIIQDQRAEINKLKEYNKALRYRCKALTKGTVCFYCPMECEHRTVAFRTDRDKQ